MNTILEWLSIGDLTSDGQANEVAKLMSENIRLLPDLVAVSIIPMTSSAAMGQMRWRRLPASIPRPSLGTSRHSCILQKTTLSPWCAGTWR